MKALELKYKDSCRVSDQELTDYGKRCKPEIARIQSALTQGYESDYASLNVVTDEISLEIVHNVIADKKALNPTMLIVIGIGGSNLGAMAVHEAINGTFYNESDPATKVYWADSVDIIHIQTIASFMEQALKKGENVILNVISKSGATTETIAVYQILLELLKKYKHDDAHRYVVVTTDKESKLWKLAQKEECVLLEIPKKVGGRYSVFCPVGLFPLGMLDIDTTQLVKGARSVIPEYTDEDIFNNPALLSAAVLAVHYQQGKYIHDTFVFSTQLESFGKWYRQLMGESIGKEFNRQGEQVHVGITPTVSVGSVDLHSVGQLYLAGPNNRCTTFVSVHNFPSLAYSVVPQMQDYELLVENIAGKSLPTIQHAILQGVQAAYKKRLLPYLSVSISDISAFSIGQLLQCKMLEIMYLGYMLDVNPFDQPNVELYKQETREILKV